MRYRSSALSRETIPLPRKQITRSTTQRRADTIHNDCAIFLRTILVVGIYRWKCDSRFLLKLVTRPAFLLQKSL
jgi:hypothetical protein